MSFRCIDPAGTCIDARLNCLRVNWHHDVIDFGCFYLAPIVLRPVLGLHRLLLRLYFFNPSFRQILHRLNSGLPKVRQLFGLELLVNMPEILFRLNWV